MKKKKSIFIIIFVILIILLILVLFPKTSGVIHKNNEKLPYYSTKIYETRINNEITEQTYSELNKKVNIEKTSTSEIQKKGEQWDEIKLKKAGVATIYSPFYSKHNWVSQITDISEDRVEFEIFNNRTESMMIDDMFTSFLGNDFEGYVVKSEIVEGAGELKPGEKRKVVVKGDGEARYFVIGKDFLVEDWAIYRTITTNSVANDSDLPDIKSYSKYIIDSLPMVANFDEFNLLPYTTVLVDKNKYEKIKITENERKNHPDSCIMAIEIDLYNKMNKDLEINGLTYIIKDGENNNVESFTLDDYKLSLDPEERQSLYLPFKYLGQEYLHSVILKSNLGDITIENPENIYGLIKKESV